MKLQDLLYPVKDLMQWTFELIIEGSLPNIINWTCVALLVVLLLGWIRMQMQYDKKAAESGRIA
jgi:hypothetical protein